MKLSFDWLGDYVDLEGVTPEEVAKALTMGAFEVEEVRSVRPPISGKVVVGEILEIYPHPNANKIRLTKTRVEPGAEPLEIVCGAANIEVGQRIPVALSGACVIDRHTGKELKIEARAVRGVVSNGMLCSPPELGLTLEENEGILILPTDTEIGTDIVELLYLKPDSVLHVEPRSNRGDALSVVGLAREVAALLRRRLKYPEMDLPAESASELDFKVDVETFADCPFFSARVIADVEAKPSPAKIARRLEAIDVRLVNSVVDITNYVMHEYGQPLHAYDYNFLSGHELKVRRAHAGEELTTLDGKERKLSEEELVITDANKPVGVAGIMGGKDSEIADTTKLVVLEAASFQPARVRRGGRRLGLSSDASLRFERGVDVATVAKASDRAAYLMLQHCSGAKPARLGKFVKAGHGEIKPLHVTCRIKALKKVLGKEFTQDEVKELLTPLGFEVFKGAEDAVQIAVPSFRQNDVTREIDIVEEVCRLWGYDKLPVSMPTTYVPVGRPRRVQDTVRDILSGMGLNETLGSSLVAGDDQSGMFEEERAVRVLNPLSAEHQVLRQALLPGLMKAAAFNYDYGQRDIWLFEVGRTYQRKGETDARDAFESGTGVNEQYHVSGVLYGENELSEWSDHRKGAAKQEFDFYHAKGVVENLLTKLRVDMDRVHYLRPDRVPTLMHPSRSCQVAVEPKRKGKAEPQPEVVGWIAQIHPAVEESMRLKRPAFVFELNISALESGIASEKFAEIASTPSVNRDLTVDLFDAVDHAAVETCIRSACGKDLRSVELVSIYQPAEGQKSLSFRLTFQNPERTLQSEEIDNTLLKVRESLTNRLSGWFRT